MKFVPVYSDSLNLYDGFFWEYGLLKITGELSGPAYFIFSLRAIVFCLGIGVNGGCRGVVLFP